MKKLECNQCGQCCNNMALKISPDELRESYLNWRHNKTDNEGKIKNHYAESWLLYPLLKHKHFDKKSDSHRYSCRALGRKAGKYVCGIYEDRPKMCADFGDEAIQTGVPLDKGHKKLYSDCSLIENDS